MFADGSVQIVDRIKDVIKTGGEWVSSIGLESLIGDVAGVQEAAVIGVKDEKWGNGRWRSSSVSPTRRSTQTRSAPTCSLWSNQTASASTRCRRIAFVAEIPKTSVGKIDKKVLRERNA
jgi:fatty-acyl-CoA synthase